MSFQDCSTLLVNVVSARDLHIRGHRPVDVYVSLATSGKGPWKSKVTTNPIRVDPSAAENNPQQQQAEARWDEHFKFQLTDADTKLVIHVKHKALLGSAETLGELVLPLDGMARFQPAAWFRLAKPGSFDAKDRGQIQLCYQFSNGVGGLSPKIEKVLRSLFPLGPAAGLLVQPENGTFCSAITVSALLHLVLRGDGVGAPFFSSHSNFNDDFGIGGTTTVPSPLTTRHEIKHNLTYPGPANTNGEMGSSAGLGASFLLERVSPGPGDRRSPAAVGPSAAVYQHQQKTPLRTSPPPPPPFVDNSKHRLERCLCSLESLMGGNSHNSSSSSSPLASTSIFDLAVLELVQQLRGVLQTSHAISNTVNDPIKLADLYIHLANSCRGSPALRAEFFDALAAQHIAGGWYSEAAVGQAHALAIIGRELEARGGLFQHHRVDWTLLDVLSGRIASDEGLIGCQNHCYAANGNSQSQSEFTSNKFAHKANELVRSLLMAERYEAVGPIFRLVLPIFEHIRDFKELARIHCEIQKAYVRAEEVKANGKRHLGTYFKVAFFGQSHFGVEHRVEWVYREPKLMSLAEACERMLECTRATLGHDRVQMLNERCAEDGVPNDPNIAYVQVAHVEPIRRKGTAKWHNGLMIGNGVEERNDGSGAEEEEDPSDYDLHTNVNTFVQEERLRDTSAPADAPELARTALRRLILTVENAFPDTRRRQRVLRVEERVLNPLELACECLRTKAAQLRRIVHAAGIGRRPVGGGVHAQLVYDQGALERLDLKKLQLFLQGTVSPSVNAGLLAYAETFTSLAQRKRYGKEGIGQLMAALNLLIAELAVALSVNEAAMGAERAEYQQMLRRSFDAMLERVPAYFGGQKFIPLPSKEGQRTAATITLQQSPPINNIHPISPPQKPQRSKQRQRAKTPPCNPQQRHLAFSTPLVN